MKLSRAIFPAALAAALLLTTACSAGGDVPTQDAEGADCLVSSKVSEAITVSGDAGVDLKLDSATPVEVTEPVRSVLKAGKGEVVKSGESIEIAMTMINGRSGKVLNQIPESPVAFTPEQMAPADVDLLRCAVPGEQAVTIVPFETVFGEDAAEADLPAEFKMGDSILMVTQTGEIVPAAEETTQAPACETFEKRDKKFPEVDLGDGKSEPKITIPKCMEAPKELEIEVLKEGTGAVVEADQEIMTNYVGVDWNGAARFDGNWTETGIPFSTQEGALIPGFTQAMIGQKIGSTVLVTMPSELGYNDGMTRTFVLQLVGAAQ